jgi:alkanesulfonate monooxygenase SsuD/methylene tetrahydromethanopterin reductase-like flavin-dependent oxidoreductase (luciferase family)
MHFGLFNLMTQRDKAKTPREIYAEMADQVRVAEDIGFEIAWFAEHHFSNYCLCPSPLTMSTYMAARTKRIKLGPAVIVVPLYEPIRMLEDIGLLDQLSDGRAVLGFGTGYQEYEFHKFGVDLKKGREIFLETMDLVEAYLKGDPVSFNGQKIKLPETYFSVRTIQKRPPVYVAGLTTDMETQRRSVERGYVPFVTTGWNTVNVIRQIKDKLRETYVAAGGETARMPFAIQRYVFVSHDRDDVLKAADGARYVRRIAQAMRNKYGELDGAYLKETPAADEPPLEEIAERTLMGDPETVAEKLCADITALEPSHMSLFMAIPGVAQHKTLRSMEMFGKEVLPLVEKRLGKLANIGVGVPGLRSNAA